MEEIILRMMDNLPTAAALLYIWVVSNNSHSKEREEWRSDIRASTEVLNAITQQVNKLTFIIENYVITDRKSVAGKQD